MYNNKRRSLPEPSANKNAIKRPKKSAIYDLLCDIPGIKQKLLTAICINVNALGYVCEYMYIFLCIFSLKVLAYNQEIVNVPTIFFFYFCRLKSWNVL